MEFRWFTPLSQCIPKEFFFLCCPTPVLSAWFDHTSRRLKIENFWVFLFCSMHLSHILLCLSHRIFQFSLPFFFNIKGVGLMAYEVSLLHNFLETAVTGYLKHLRVSRSHKIKHLQYCFDIFIPFFFHIIPYFFYSCHVMATISIVVLSCFMQMMKELFSFVKHCLSCR